MRFKQQEADEGGIPASRGMQKSADFAG